MARLEMFKAIKQYNKEYGRLIINEDSEGFQYTCESVVGPRAYKIHNALNIILNIIASDYVFFIADIPLWIVPLIMIVFDIVLMPINYLFIWVFPVLEISGNNIGLKIKKLFFLLRPKKLKEKYLKKLENKINEKQTFLDAYRRDFSRYQKNEIRKEITMLETQVSDYKEYLEKSKKEEAEVVDYFTKSNLNDIDYIRNILNKIEEEKGKYPDWIQTKLSTIIEKSRTLLLEVEEDTSSVNLVMKTYNIYLGELIKITNQYMDMDKSQQINNKQTIKDLMQKFEKHIEILSDKVKDFKQNDLNRDTELLMSILDDYEKENKTQEGV